MSITQSLGKRAFSDSLIGRHKRNLEPMGRPFKIIIFCGLWLNIFAVVSCAHELSVLDKSFESRNGHAKALRLCRTESHQYEEIDFDETEEEDLDLIADPLEPVNRAFFMFNDRLYFWVLKPVSTGYEKVLPEPARIGVGRFFSNLFMPIRAVNCLLQGKICGFGIELSRFLLNSTIGVLGFCDPAGKRFNLSRQDEDFGQTLGFYGLGPGIYINWPILGPSSLRGTAGLVGDAFLNPINYIICPTKYNISVKTYEVVNDTSLTLGEYESLKKAALDPYVSLRDAYYQYRRTRIKK